MKNLIDFVSNRLDKRILKYEVTPGGDINSAFKLTLPDGIAFLKCNNYPQGFQMLRTEAEALNHIRATQKIRTPSVLDIGQLEAAAYLVLEFVIEFQSNSGFWRTFGSQLAQLHTITNNQFGYRSQNFIGSLVQTNEHYSSWPDFYYKCRIEPQLQTARDNGLIDKTDVRLFNFLQIKGHNLFPNEKPSLVHGDLWSGNFLIGDNHPVLIDPATYYGHREVDIAMTALFGGFQPLFYQAYHETNPLASGWLNRLELYQLYPLLVHLNLFGRSYLSSIHQIVRKYAG